MKKVDVCHMITNDLKRKDMNLLKSPSPDLPFTNQADCNRYGFRIKH